MKNLSIVIALILGALAFPFVSPAQTPDLRDLVSKTVKAIDQGKTLEFQLKRKERFGGKMVTGELVTKINVSPLKIYIKNHYPDDGSEILWLKGKNDGKALVNPNSFPYFNLKLNPRGSLMMNNQHHSLFELGFGLYKRIIENALQKYGDQFDQYVRYEGIKTFDGRPCHVVVIDYDGYKLVPYTVKAGEDLFKIARKLVVSEYLIMEANTSIDDYFDVKEGDVIMVPNVYSKKSIVYIDKVHHLPLIQEVHDLKGMFERYEYSNLKLNPGFAPEEFTENYKDYKF